MYIALQHALIGLIDILLIISISEVILCFPREIQKFLCFRYPAFKDPATDLRPMIMGTECNIGSNGPR